MIWNIQENRNMQIKEMSSNIGNLLDHSICFTLYRLTRCGTQTSPELHSLIVELGQKGKTVFIDHGKVRKQKMQDVCQELVILVSFHVTSDNTLLDLI